MSDSGLRATRCGERLWVAQWETRCVLDKGHDGPCQSYAQVLRLNFPTATEKPRV